MQGEKPSEQSQPQGQEDVAVNLSSDIWALGPSIGKSLNPSVIISCREAACCHWHREFPDFSTREITGWIKILHKLVGQGAGAPARECDVDTDESNTRKGMMGTKKKAGPRALGIFGWGESAYSWRDELKVFIRSLLQERLIPALNFRAGTGAKA